MALAAGQAITALRFVAVLRRATRSPASNAPSPKVAVILCLRGADPFLDACLKGALSQDYPRYDVRIIVDSCEDPAWAIAERAATACGGRNVCMEPLVAPRRTCSLKCSSLLQAISRLDASYEAVALLDADTIPHRTWLRELLAPLADERVAASTGNRWYAPNAPSWGGLVRRLWNTAAVVEMYWFHIPWGGTLALKLSVVRRSGLLERWGNAFCDDTIVYGVLRRMGYRVAFAPSLMMVNREACGVRSFYRWVRRQLLAARLYHPAWGLVVGHAAATTLAQTVGLIALAAAVILGNGGAAAWLAGGVGLYWTIMIGLLATIEGGVRRNAQARGEFLTNMRIAEVPRVLVAMILTQMVYAAAMISAILLRVVDWRGIRYRVNGPDGIRIVEYKPYVESPEPHSVRDSL